MANEKTQVEIDAAVDAAIKVNGNREITPPLHNAIEKMLSNSNLNKKDGGILQALAFYNSAFSLTDPLTLVYKSYVDDLITALNAITQGTNTLTVPLILNGNPIQTNNDIEITDITKGIIMTDQDGSGNRYRITILGASFNFELLP